MRHQSTDRRVIHVSESIHASTGILSLPLLWAKTQVSSGSVTKTKSSGQCIEDILGTPENFLDQIYEVSCTMYLTDDETHHSAAECSGERKVYLGVHL